MMDIEQSLKNIKRLLYVSIFFASTVLAKNDIAISNEIKETLSEVGIEAPQGSQFINFDKHHRGGKQVVVGQIFIEEGQNRSHCFFSLQDIFIAESENGELKNHSEKFYISKTKIENNCDYLNKKNEKEVIGKNFTSYEDFYSFISYFHSALQAEENIRKLSTISGNVHEFSPEVTVIEKLCDSFLIDFSFNGLVIESKWVGEHSDLKIEKIDKVSREYD